MSEIIPDLLYLGNAQIARDLDLLKKLKITHIINLAGKEHFPSEFLYFKKHFEDDDEEDITKHLDSIFQFIDQRKKGERVFIHCQGGISRSPTICIAYLMKKNKISFDEAHQYVKNKRPSTRIKKGFEQQLKNYLDDKEFEQ